MPTCDVRRRSRTCRCKTSASFECVLEKKLEYVCFGVGSTLCCYDVLGIKGHLIKCCSWAIRRATVFIILTDELLPCMPWRNLPSVRMPHPKAVGPGHSHAGVLKLNHPDLFLLGVRKRLQDLGEQWQKQYWTLQDFIRANAIMVYANGAFDDDTHSLSAIFWEKSRLETTILWSTAEHQRVIKLQTRYDSVNVAWNTWIFLPPELLAAFRCKEVCPLIFSKEFATMYAAPARWQCKVCALSGHQTEHNRRPY